MSNKFSKFGKYRKTNISLKSISELPWYNIINIDQQPKEVQVQQLERFRVNNVLPQLLAFIASPRFKLVSVNGKFHFGESLKVWAALADEGKLYFDDGKEVSKEDLRGMMSFLRVTPRSVILPTDATQLSQEWLRYSTPVPLFLSAFKQYRNINYKQWDLDDPKLVICTDYRNFQVFDWIGGSLKFSTSDLIKFRDNARRFKTGQKAGTMRSLNATYTISATEDPDFNVLPENIKLMLCQVWVYQPGCTTQYGLYTIDDPDGTPESLVDTEVFVPSFKDRNHDTNIDDSRFDF